MKYKNLRTGVVIDTPDIIAGGNWVLESDYKSSEEVNEHQENTQEENDVEQEQQEIVVEDKEELNQSKSEQNNQEEITKVQIMQELDAFGIEYNPRDKKQVLYELMMNHEQ